MRLHIIAYCNINKRHGIDLIEDAPGKGGFESAPNVSDTLPTQTPCFVADPASRKPDPEPVNW
jgi:hypothetical protein